MKITASLLFQPSDQPGRNIVRPDVEFREAAALALATSMADDAADGTFIVEVNISEAGPRDAMIEVKFPTATRLKNADNLSADYTELVAAGRLPQPLFAFYHTALRDQRRWLDSLVLKAGLEI